MSETNIQEKMTIEGIDVGKVKNFPFSALKTLGSIQMGIGGICICVGLVDFLMFIFFEDKFLTDPAMKDTEAYQKVDTLTKTFTPVWCGIWFCVTGAFAAMLTEKKLANVNYYKMTFLILSITCAAVSGPLCFIVTVTSAYLRHEIKPDGFRWLVPLLVTFFAFCEIIFAIVSSAVCCCCSPFDSSRVRVLLAKQQDDGFHAIVNQEKDNRNTFDIFTTADKEGKPLPPRKEEIKKPPPNQRPITKENKKQKTPIKEEPPQDIKQPEDDNRHSKDRKSEAKQSRDRKSERKQSSNAHEDTRRRNSDDLSEPPFDDDEAMPTRGYNDRPYTKGSSYEQLKSLAIPRTAPKQTF